MSAELAGRRISRLEIRMGVPDIGDGGYLYPVARLLIDGQDLLARAGRPGFGFVPWPAEQLLTGEAPLLPAQPPRRVVLYAQSPDPCGLAPRISGHDDVVIWSDFHDVCGVGEDPLVMREAWDWTPAALPDLAFDARQYTAEVRRATAAREWESDAWQTALLLRAWLRADPLAPGDEWELGFTEPDRERAGRYHVTYWTPDLSAVTTVPLTAGPGTPQQQAQAMFDYLLATPTARWPATQYTHDTRR
jgi:hypothetical protein